MRGLLIRRNRRIRVFGFTLALAVIYMSVFHENSWLRRAVENKVDHFMGDRLSVRIKEVKGGVFRDMMLQDVEFSAGDAPGASVFRLERMEISYRLWRVLLEKLGIAGKEDDSPSYMSMYFSDENPFVRGFLTLYSYPDRIEMIGLVSPVLFDEERKRRIKGVFLRRDDGKYDCDVMWDRKTSVIGTLDPVSRSVDLGFEPLSGKRGTVKLKGTVGEDKVLEVYSRLDKVDIFGTEIIGDVWLSYNDSEEPGFSVKAENLIIDKRPFWDASVSGVFLPAEKAVAFDALRWGEGVELNGTVGMEAPYPVDVRLSASGVELKDLAETLGEGDVPVRGVMEGNVEIKGPAAEALVKGRLFVGEGAVGSLEFRSISATLKGKMPVISITDGRVIKDGGNIIVSGELDFRSVVDNKVFEKLVFRTDNKVAVWEDWQISKGKSEHRVEARKDKVTFSTWFEDDDIQKDPAFRINEYKEVGLNYQIEGGNSIKLGFEEDDDFVGMEHKMRF